MDPLRGIRIITNRQIERVTNRRCDDTSEGTLDARLEAVLADLQQEEHRQAREAERLRRMAAYPERLRLLADMRGTTVQEESERFDSSAEDLPDENF